MAPPRLTKVACPECSAAMRVDAGAAVVTCAYCRKSSFVHWPNQPTPAATSPDYGHIHVPARAMGTVGTILLLSGVVTAAILAAVVGLVLSNAPTIAIGAPKGSAAMPAGPRSIPAGASCERAVACCKAIQPSNAGCDGLRLMSEADCSRQIEALASAAKALGRSCD